MGSIESSLIAVAVAVLGGLGLFITNWLKQRSDQSTGQKIQEIASDRTALSNIAKANLAAASAAPSITGDALRLPDPDSRD